MTLRSDEIQQSAALLHGEEGARGISARRNILLQGRAVSAASLHDQRRAARGGRRRSATANGRTSPALDFRHRDARLGGCGAELPSTGGTRTLSGVG